MRLKRIGTAARPASMKASKRAFWAAFMASLCVIVLIGGLTAADQSTRRIGFGKTEPAACVSTRNDRVLLEIDAMGIKGSWDVTGLWRAGEAVYSFVARAADKTERIIQIILE